MPKPKKRSALEVLTKKRLVQLARAHELDVASSQPKAEFIAALARSKKASFAAILAELNRSELKDICRAHALDDSGKRKAKIAARILGTEPVPNEAEPPKHSETKTAKAKPARAQRQAQAQSQQLELPRDGKLGVAELEGYLWSAADILRGSIDSSDYKQYIFGMLFLKRLSDVFEEEVQALIAEGVDEHDARTDPDEHQELFVPELARWSTLMATGDNIGAALNKACVALEERNASALEGVLGGIDYNDPTRLGGTKNRDSVLGRLVQHFSKLELGNANLSEPDMLGRAYEYLIEKFADDAGKKGGEFYTPHMVVRLIVELLAPRAGMRICDPTCGSGGMLIQCAKYIGERGGNTKNLALHGQEKNLNTWAICKMNMLLHGRGADRIEKGDTIRDPKLVTRDGALIVYDRVIANPPFSLDDWGRGDAETDPHRRFEFGIPPKSKGDLAFVQHMVATTKAEGKVGVVVPHGVLFRGSAEGKIRAKMLQDDLVEAVICLPSGLFYGTGIPAAVLVLARGKSAERAGKLLFVDASGEFEEGKNQNRLRKQDVAKIVAAFEGFADVAKYARVVELAEVEGNEFNLNISRYVDTSEPEERIDVGDAVRRLRELEKERGAAEVKMNAFLEELGYGVA